jgi:hypothetical protein
MKKVVAVSLPILLIVSVFTNSIRNANASTTTGPRITRIKGENVFVARKSNGVDVWKARPGEELKDGDEVIVGLGSEATVTYPDGSQHEGTQGHNVEVEYEPPPEPGWFARFLKGAWKFCKKAGKILQKAAEIYSAYRAARDIIKSKSLWKGFYNNETGISEISVFNGTVSVTTTRNDIVINSCNITGSLYFDEYAIPWANVQEIVLYEDGTISEPTEVVLDATEMAFTPYGSDSGGVPKVVFHLGEDIYVCGFGTLLRPSTDVAIYLMPYNLPFTEYSPGKAVVSNIARADNWGNLPSTYLWKPTESKNIGGYNIWIDRDNSGYYNTGDMINYLGVEAPPVGGIWVPVDKFGLLSPYIGLASTLIVATVATAIYVKRVKRREEK